MLLIASVCCWCWAQPKGMCRRDYILHVHSTLLVHLYNSASAFISAFTSVSSLSIIFFIRKKLRCDCEELEHSHELLRIYLKNFPNFFLKKIVVNPAPGTLGQRSNGSRHSALGCAYLSSQPDSGNVRLRGDTHPHDCSHSAHDSPIRTSHPAHNIIP